MRLNYLELLRLHNEVKALDEQLTNSKCPPELRVAPLRHYRVDLGKTRYELALTRSYLQMNGVEVPECA